MMSSDNVPKFPKVAEKRFHQRLECELPVELTAEGLKLSATTANISCGGMFLPEFRQPVSEKSQLTIVLTLPEQAHAIKLSGEIARIENDDSARREGMAVRFNELYNDNILLIERFIKARLKH